MSCTVNTLRWDFDGDGEWSAMSCVHDDGYIFEWRIQVCEDGTFSIAASDGELCARPETFESLREAKQWCNDRDAEYLEQAKREAAQEKTAEEV